MTVIRVFPDVIALVVFDPDVDHFPDRVVLCFNVQVQVYVELGNTANCSFDGCCGGR